MKVTQVREKDRLLQTIAGWIAPAATMIAAMMTAANLGARMTGWGFVVFTVGSICWSLVGLGTGQTNLLATNAFLTLVNLVGVWRWLGRQRSYEDGGKSAAMASRAAAVPTLFTATGIAGLIVKDCAGETIGRSVEALIECESRRISYVVIAAGGIGGIDEDLRAVPCDLIAVKKDCLIIDMTREAFCSLPLLGDGDWPARIDPVERAVA